MTQFWDLGKVVTFRLIANLGSLHYPVPVYLKFVKFALFRKSTEKRQNILPAVLALGMTRNSSVIKLNVCVYNMPVLGYVN
ncbi:hypothetical protein F441_15260 [Phytophthora nicotianae CJ01A1]|uniref:Uncharacterized protein n=2 Tax=Phytophthora nicotianae TaxID=4792 RepID=W2GA35_PHYNI|nr:hypothetical protein L915_14995 [Phytophthora nicotianae]ETL85806.1 hypothetical protein L917_14707 [Phytophthora nicotianae]ETP08813.1 hypothetical protein F441_15260 [Phytophthora nicotianae CJ01A1]